MSLNSFHPAVSTWFTQTFGAPTEVQRQAWPAIQRGESTLITAPTGSGKTLAAFLATIDALVREGLARGLSDATYVLYVSPLKALSNDIQKNLEAPLAGIRDELFAQQLPDVEIRAWVRTGDTPQSERTRMRKQPPHILVTTPESLFILLTSASGREMLQSVRTVIVDETHALAGNKRGAHLMLSLARLDALCEAEQGRAPVRVGLSATQKPIEDMARFLTGKQAGCTIVDTGHVRKRDLAIEVPRSPLEAIMAAEVWAEVYDRLAELIAQHRTTLIFVNTRRLAERAARFLAERLGEANVTAHHGSLAREHRLDAEQRLKGGKLRALVATASLELGIDIGDVDLVCQLGSPRNIATLLQRVGRSGHAVGALPKGRLFPLSRDDLLECTALLDAIQRDELDRILMPHQPLDVLAQQIVAEVAAREWEEAALYQHVIQAWPYRALSRETYTEVVRMLAEGFSTRRGRRSAFLYRDAIHGRLRARPGARLTAITNGGAIPDLFDYDVVLAPEGYSIGSVNEDFAFESLPGDVFQLGNTSYRILKIEQGRVHVEDAHGQPPNIPFWIGEAPGRSDELSQAVSRLRAHVAAQLEHGLEATQAWLQQHYPLPPAAAQQLAEYLAAAKAALGVVPSLETIVFERFFDDVGDMHFVIHAPFGSRINRAWGLSLRKRFCRKFNFELQAAASEDNIILSLGPTHSFPLAEVADYLKPATVREILIQALLAAPLFGTRWRWVANIALAVPRTRNGKRVPAQFQRSDAEDLVAVVFPDQLACFENISGDREVPDHPLVNQTLRDCLYEAMDVEGLERVLTHLASGELKVVCCDLTHPSPLALEIINARPYAYLDDAPVEERRTLSIQQRRYLDPETAADLGRLDPHAIARVRAEAWPDARTADELHDGLIVLGFMTEAEGRRGPLEAGEGLGFDWQHLFATLTDQSRATLLTTPAGERLWVAAERLAQLQLLFPDAPLVPPIEPFVEGNEAPLQKEAALRELIRSRLEGLGPVTVAQLAAPLGLSTQQIDFALLELEQEGFVIQGQFTLTTPQTEWCERRLLARIHRYTLKQLRSEIEAVPAADYMRFLFHWQRLAGERGEGQAALAGVLEQLEGYSIPAALWEEEILPARIADYSADLLENLCLSGRITWLRLTLPKTAAGHKYSYLPQGREREEEVSSAPERKREAAPVRITPIALLARAHAPDWRALNPVPAREQLPLSSAAHKILTALEQRGALFFIDLVQLTGLLRTQVEEALAELVAWGLVTADSYAGLRALIAPQNRRPGFGQSRHRRRATAVNVDDAGRWSLLLRHPATVDYDAAPIDARSEHLAHIALTLLRRYGVVMRKVLEREANLPPWRELLYVYRRMEARGEIRGGRFVQGLSGEQFALPEAVATLREQRKRASNGEMLVITAVDPLNLAGIITPGQKIPAQGHNRILYRDGVPIAAAIAGEIHYLAKLPPHQQQEARQMLIRKAPGQVLRFQAS
ncbi:MAG: DEAD/DEAH box helicase [Pseudomonadota bacterium]